MTELKLTKEALEALVSGKRVTTKHPNFGLPGRNGRIELVPPSENGAYTPSYTVIDDD